MNNLEYLFLKIFIKGIKKVDYKWLKDNNLATDMRNDDCCKMRALEIIAGECKLNERAG